MRNSFVLMLVFFAISCNNNNSEPGTSKDSSVTKTTSQASGSFSGKCGSLYIFRKGAVAETMSYDANGKEISKQVSTVVSVSNQGNMVASEVEMKSTGIGDDEKVFKGKYSCDGNNLFVDLTSLFSSMEAQGAKIQGDAISFPINISEGQVLPDASYTLTMTQDGKEMKITSFMKERRVDGREKITTAAGTFDCYKISTIVEVNMEMPGMDDNTKKMMEEMKKKMPKQKFVMYFDPAVSIVKMDMFSGDKLTSRSEVVSIKN